MAWVWVTVWGSFLLPEEQKLSTSYEISVFMWECPFRINLWKIFYWIWVLFDFFGVYFQYVNMSSHWPSGLHSFWRLILLYFPHTWLIQGITAFKLPKGFHLSLVFLWCTWVWIYFLLSNLELITFLGCVN